MDRGMDRLQGNTGMAYMLAIGSGPRHTIWYSILFVSGLRWTCPCKHGRHGRYAAMHAARPSSFYLIEGRHHRSSSSAQLAKKPPEGHSSRALRRSF